MSDVIMDAEVILNSSSLMTHDFEDVINDRRVYFHVIKMKDSFFLWIGVEAKMNNLALAMSTKFVSTEC